MSKNIKRYLISSIITFIATFAAAVVPMIGDLDFSKGAIVALVMVGVRAAMKALFEALAKINMVSIED